MLFDKTRVKSKLLITTLIVLYGLLFAAFIGGNVVNKIKIGSVLYQKISHYKDLQIAINDLKNALHNIRVLYVTVFTTESNSMHRHTQLLEEAIKDVDSHFNNTLNNIYKSDIETKLVLNAAKFTWNEYKSTLTDIIMPRILGGQKEVAIALANDIQNLRQNRFTEQVDSAENTMKLKIYAYENSVNSIVSNHMTFLLSLTFFIFILIAFIKVKANFSITKPLDELFTAVNSYRKGDFDHKVNLVGHDELCQLGETLNKMADDLQNFKKSERNKAKEWENTFNSITEMVSIQNRDLKYQKVNKAFLEAFGVNEDDVIGKNCFEFIHKTNKPNEICPCRKTMNTKQIIKQDCFNTNLGMYLEETTAPILDEKGGFKGVVHVAKNVTDFKEQEDKSIELQNELLHAQKMESIGTMANGIAHNFNNILGALRGYAEMAMMSISKKNESYTDLEKVIECVDLAKILVKGMLAFSRHSTVTLQPLDLKSVIIDSIDLFKASMSIPITLILDIENANSLILGDQNQLQQVILNLCNNSYHEIDGKNGKIEIKLQNFIADYDTIAKNPYFQKGNYVQLSIKDSGKGMDEATLNRIFEPFFTTKDIGKGTGLGLSIVHGIIKSHSGEITVESKLGKGAKFSIYFPTYIDQKVPVEV